MSRRFPKEVHDFIRANVDGCTTQDLAAMVNEHFGEQLFTPATMKNYKANNKLRSGTPCGLPKGHPSDVFPQPVADYIRSNYIGVGNQELADRVNTAFGTTYTRKQICAYKKNHGLTSGLTGRFEKGCVSHNKGKKGQCAAGSEKGWFAGGHTPHNKLPVGTVLTKTDGYLWRKIGEGSRDWRQEHRLVWEAANGPVPKGHVLIFKDNDKMNCALDNLALISLAENAQMNTRKLRSTVPEHTETGILMAKIHNAVRQRRGHRGHR